MIILKIAFIKKRTHSLPFHFICLFVLRFLLSFFCRAFNGIAGVCHRDKMHSLTLKCALLYGSTMWHFFSTIKFRSVNKSISFCSLLSENKLKKNRIERQKKNHSEEKENSYKSYVVKFRTNNENSGFLWRKKGADKFDPEHLGGPYTLNYRQSTTTTKQYQ